MKNRKQIISIILAIVLSVTAVGSSFYSGYHLGLANVKTIKIEGVANIAPPASAEKKPDDFSIFWQVWDKLRQSHLNSKKVNDQQMIYGAVKGLAANMDDPYTTFFTPEEAKNFTEEISGRFGGIGARLEENYGQIVVVAPIKGTPADRVGILAKDVIIKANDIPLAGKNVQEAVKIIRGEPGTVVRLIIARNGADGLKEFNITREIIQVPVIKSETKGNNLAYIRVYNFTENSGVLFAQAAYEAIKQNPRGIILDLRNNPGGYLEMAVDISSWFINKNDVVVKEHYASGEETLYRGRGPSSLKDVPVVILVNQGSASASEIVAGALRDQTGAKLIGEKTYGKGSVQTLEEFKDKSLLKITVANWLTPKGSVIDQLGLTPDVKIAPSEDKTKDVELDKAIETLESEIKK